MSLRLSVVQLYELFRARIFIWRLIILNMSESDEGNQLPLRKRYKLWKTDPTIPIPHETLLRWKKIERLETQDAAHDFGRIFDDAGEEESQEDLDRNIHFPNINQNSSDGDESDIFRSDESENEFLSTAEGGIQLIVNAADIQGVIDDDVNDITNDESDSDSYDTDDEVFGNELLYNDSKINVTEAVAALMDIYTHHKLTKAAITSILKFLQRILPNSNVMPKTRYKLFKFVETQAPEGTVQTHYYCKGCRKFLQNGKGSICDSCLNEQDSGIFYELDVVSQVRFLFEKRNLASKLKPISVMNMGIIADISDGSEYKRVNLRNDKGAHDLTLILNTDGLSLVKSNKSHCWPIMFMIAELPQYLRESHLVTIGLWYDRYEKPLMNTFLRPFCEKFKKCFHNGIIWVDPITNQPHISKIVVPLIIADGPARAEILNMFNYNGRFGCNICEHETKSCRKISGKTTIRVYAFSEEIFKLRSSAGIKAQAVEAITSGKKQVKGIKGPTIISSLPLIDLSSCVVPEYMHSVLLGVGKQFLKLWIHKRGKWNVTKHRNLIDDFITNIRPPLSFHRLPRSIFLYHFFKAYEFYNWILYYSLPTLHNYLPDEYFKHWILLVAGLFYLVQDRITEIDIRKADVCFRLFVRDIEKLYGDREYTYNVHQLLHLALCVRRWGPLWATSAFPFENYNGFLANCVHGSKHQGAEIIKNLMLAQGAKQLMNSSNAIEQLPSASEARKFKLLGRSYNQPKFFKGIEKRLLEAHDVRMNDLVIYARARLKGMKFTSQLYKATKTDSSNVKLKLNDRIVYGSIRFFFKLEDDISFILQRLSITSNRMFAYEEGTDLKVEHILPMKAEEDYMLFKATDIETIYHLVKVGEYACEHLNQFAAIM